MALMFFGFRDGDPVAELLRSFGNIEGRISLFLMLFWFFCLLFFKDLLKLSHFFGIATLTEILETCVFLL